MFLVASGWNLVVLGPPRPSKNIPNHPGKPHSARLPPSFVIIRPKINILGEIYRNDRAIRAVYSCLSARASVVLMDSDTLVLQNVDELLWTPAPGATLDRRTLLGGAGGRLSTVRFRGI